MPFADEMRGPSHSVTARDRRERETWFRRLDPDAQAVVRERWSRHEEEWSRLARARRRDPRHALADGVLVVAGSQALVVFLVGMVAKAWTAPIVVSHAVLLLGLASAAGLATGGVWWATAAARATCFVSGPLVVLAVQAVGWRAGWIHGASLPIGLAVAAASSWWIGARRGVASNELRRRSRVQERRAVPARPRRDAAAPVEKVGRTSPAPVRELGPVAGPDERERSEWFRRLDEDAQAVVRERWRQREESWADLERRWCLGRREALVEGAGTLAGAHLLVLMMFAATGPTNLLLQLAVAGLFGVATGALWNAIGAGSLLCLLTSMGASFVVEALCVGAGWLRWPALVAGPWIAGFLGRLVGLRREEIPGS